MPISGTGRTVLIRFYFRSMGTRNLNKISLNCHYCSDVTAVPDVDIGIALTSQQCHMPDIGTPASFELVWYQAISAFNIFSGSGLGCGVSGSHYSLDWTTGLTHNGIKCLLQPFSV